MYHRSLRPCRCEQCAAAALQPVATTEPRAIRRQPYTWPQVQPLPAAETVMRPAWPRIAAGSAA